MQARQGDLWFKPSSIPQDAEPLKDRTILAEGEVTGHNHRLANKAIGMLYLLGTALYLRMIQEGDILHTGPEDDTHKSITLPPGDYAVIIQREQDPFGHIRQVVD